MTPPAATAAGRALPRTVAPRNPRRVSGPARPKRDPRAAAPRRATTARRRPAAGEPLAVRALLRGQAMADSRFLQRLIGGRLWIPIVAGALIGIVFMQVTMLRMNAGISQTVDRASALERDNAALRADVSRLESGERIDRVASGLGMVVPGESGQFYVQANARDAARAAIRMTSPDATAVARTQAAAAATAATTTATTGAASTGAATTAAVSAPATTTSAPATTTTAATTAATSTGTVTPAAQTGPAPSSQAAVTPPAPTGAGTPASAGTTTALAQQGTATTAASGGTVAPTSGQG